MPAASGPTAWNNGLTRQLRPGSALMEELAGPVTDCQTRFIVYWSDLDQVVVPQRNAALHHEDLNVHNIALHGVGHMSLPITGSVVHGISAALAHLDTSGATVTPGVSALRTRRHRRGPRRGPGSLTQRRADAPLPAGRGVWSRLNLLGDKGRQGRSSMP